MEKKKKKRIAAVMLMTFFCSTMLASCGSGNGNTTTTTGDAGEEKVVLRLANVMATGSNVTLGLEKLQELVQEKSNGNLQIELHSNAVLGSDRATTEQVQGGALEMATCSSPNMSSFIPSFMAFDLPYITSSENQEKIYAALDEGKLGEYYRNAANEVGLEIIMFSEYGYRNFATSKQPLNSIDDLKNLKLRTTDSLVEVAVAEALGAIAMPVAWAETYAALQQGSVDGEGNTFSLLYSAKHHEALKYAIVSEHNYSMHILVMNKGIYDGLSDTNKAILQEAAAEALEYQRNISAQVEEEAKQSFIDSGIVVYEPTAAEKQQFIDSTKDVWTMFPQQIPQEVVDLIIEAQQ